MAMQKQLNSGALEGRDFEALNMEFQFVGTFGDQASGEGRNEMVVQDHTMFSEAET